MVRHALYNTNMSGVHLPNVMPDSLLEGILLYLFAISLLSAGKWPFTPHIR